MMAANCDVIGFDYYVPTFLSAAVDSLIHAANKPVMIGEYRIGRPLYAMASGYERLSILRGRLVV